MDNGKDFANHETLGQDRSVRAMEDSLMETRSPNCMSSAE